MSPLLFVLPLLSVRVPFVDMYRQSNVQAYQVISSTVGFFGEDCNSSQNYSSKSIKEGKQGGGGDAGLVGNL